MDDSFISKWGGVGGGIIALICSFFLIGDVYAQESTPTPTVTPAPIFNNTGTPAAFGDCPVGTPYPTPLSIDYYTYCAVCIPPTPTPLTGITPIGLTPIPYGTLPPDGYTPVPSGTPSPSATPTSEFTATPTENSSYIPSVVSVYDGANIPQLIVDSENITRISYSPGTELGMKISNNAPAGIHHVIGVEYFHGGLLRYQSGGWYNRWRFYFENKNQLNLKIVFADDSAIYPGVTINLGNGISNIIPLTQFNESLNFDQLIKFNIEYDSVDNTGYDIKFVWFYQSAHDPTYGSVIMQQVWDWGGLNPIPTPTPSPTPIPGYCNEYDYEGDTPMVDLPPIYVIPGDCIKIIPDFVINLPAVGEVIPVINWGINGMSICPMWVQIGDFQIADFVIPAELLFVPALMFILGLIFLI